MFKIIKRYRLINKLLKQIEEIHRKGEDTFCNMLFKIECIERTLIRLKYLSK